jgi:hypothetical protein
MWRSFGMHMHVRKSVRISGKEGWFFVGVVVERKLLPSWRVIRDA